MSQLKARFHVTVSDDRPPQPALGSGTSGDGRNPGFIGFFKPLCAGLLLAAFAIAALIVALLIGSVIALIFGGGLAVAVVALILRTSLRRARQ